MASTDSLPLIPNNFDSDSGAESDVPGSVAQKHQQKMDEINFARSNVRKSLPKQSDRSALLHSQSRNQDEYEYRSPKKVWDSFLSLKFYLHWVNIPFPFFWDCSRKVEWAILNIQMLLQNIYFD